METALKIPLYKCILAEYDKEPHAFKISSRSNSVVFKASDDRHMHEWLNAIQLHKLHIEETIDSINAEVDQPNASEPDASHA